MANTRNINMETETHETSFVGEKKKVKLLSKVGIFPIGIAAAVSLLCSIGFYINYSTNLDQNRQKLTYLYELTQLSEKVEKNAFLVRAAESNSFADLNSSKIRIENLLKVLKNGGALDSSDAKIKPLQDNSLVTLNRVLEQWEENKALIDTLLKKKEALPQLKIKVTETHKHNGVFLDNVFALQSAIQKNNNGINPLLSQEIIILAERIVVGTENIFSGSGFSLEKGYSLVKDLRVFNQVLQNLENGSYVFNSVKVSGESLVALNTLKKTFLPYSTITEEIVKQVTSLNDAKEVATTMTVSAKAISQISDQITKSLNEKVDSINAYRTTSLLFMLLTIMLSVLLIVKQYQKSKELSWLAKNLRRNQNNEASVDILMAQMQPLEEGDLSHKIELEDKFLQNVALGMDNARVNLSLIVTQMKQSAQRVLDIAKNNADTSGQLNSDAKSQIEKLNITLESVGNITNALDEVAQATWGAKEDSIKSKEASEQGANLVSATIDRMGGIRNNIQESSKKIKKLGESAQSITNIIDLIRDITKKINILSLNAAIQAASSKSSTREFTVLAQEVQELAKDSEQATSKIEALVKDIQIDTAEAISSMERTTQEVVEGARLTHEAGHALKQIGELSIKVAEQVEEAANKLEEKSGEMALVSFSMEELRKISEKTMISSLSSGEQVGSLQDIATEINKTVGNYKV